MVKRRCAIYMPTVYVERGYHEVFSRNWRPTEAERRLGDPQILERMQDLEKVSEDDIPEKNRSVFRMKGLDPPPEVLERRRVTERNLYEVWSGGITVTLSTDAGNIGTIHGPSIFREMALMVHAGLTPAQVLRCATTNGALAMNMASELGRVAPGFAADLVLLNSNPAEDIDNASDVSHVIRAGRAFSARKLLSGR
jgi:imidazolonepropionase-like amidohydrolase